MVNHIFLDLDGVFANFDKKIFEITGNHPHELESPKMWEAIKEYDVQHKFYSSLELIPNSLTLLSEILKKVPLKKISILTASGLKPEGDEWALQKINWVKEHLHPNLKVNWCERGAQKGLLFAKPGSLLIDDMERNVSNFILHGGMGIVHRSVEETLHTLFTRYFKGEV